MKNELFELQEKMINSDLTDYEKKETIKNIYSKKNDLQDALKSLQERNDELNKYMESFTEQDKEIVENTFDNLSLN